MKLKRKIRVPIIEFLVFICVIVLSYLIVEPIIVTVKKEINSFKNINEYLIDINNKIKDLNIEDSMNCYVRMDGNIICYETFNRNETSVIIEPNNKLANQGRFGVENGKITFIDRLTISKLNFSTTYDGKLIQMDTRQVCKPVTEETVTTGNIPIGNYDIGDEYICKVNDNIEYHFFIVSVEKDKVNLIMDRNIISDGTPATEETPGLIEWVTKEDFISAGGNEIDWGLNGNHSKGPVTAFKYLKTATKDWINLELINEVYTSEGLYDTRIYSYARLPKTNEIYGDKKCSGSSNGSCPLWLVNNLQYSEFVKGDKVNNINLLTAYWTQDITKNSTIHYVTNNGIVKNYYTINSYYNEYYRYGIRPVITLNKQNLQN